MCSKEIVAFYSYGSKIKSILLQIINSFTVVLVPRIAIYYKEKRMNEYKDLLSKALKIIILLAIPMIIGIWFTSDFLITSIYGDTFARSSTVLKILSLNLLISPIGYLLGSRVMLVSNHESRMPWCVGIGAVSNILLNACLIPSFLEVGASIASVISELITTVVYIIAAHKFFKIDRMTNSTISILISGIVMSSYLFGCSRLPTSGLIITIVQVSGCVILYFASLLVTKEEIVTNYAKGLILRLKRKS
jgi:O-antigen/teichoic acid export membrane protein